MDVEGGGDIIVNLTAFAFPKAKKNLGNREFFYSFPVSIGSVTLDIKGKEDIKISGDAADNEIYFSLTMLILIICVNLR